MNTRNNQRFRDMDKKLKEAMLTLLKDMDFEKITVKMICEKAEVNRSTFYAHYADIYEIMEQMENHLNEELLESYSDEPPTENDVFSVWPFIPFLRHIKKHRDFYKIALKERKNFPLKQGYEQMWNQIIKPNCEAAGIWSESEMMYYFVYFQAGFTFALKRWIDTGCREKEEEVALIIQNCIPWIWNRKKPSVSTSK